MNLEQPQIEEFAHNYFAANLDESKAQSEARAGGFLTALDDVPAARKLATNPLLLTVIAVLHYRSGKLPRFRAELYEKCVEQLMTQKAKKPGQAGGDDLQFVFPQHAPRKDDELLRIDYLRLTMVLRDLAFHAHARKDGEMYLTPALVKDRLVDAGVIDKKWQTRADLEKAALALLNFCEQPVGLMAYRGGHFIFVHRTFQEYLAAHYLSQQRERTLEENFLPRLIENPAHWREVLRLFFGRAIKEQSESAKYLFEHVVLPACASKKEGVITLVSECLADMEERGPLPELHQKTRETLASLRDGAYEKPPLLLACGKALSVINEPFIDPADPPLARFKTGGEFTMGASKKDDSEAYESETPHRVRLSPFAIARYPITNLQFAEFVRAGGYEKNHEQFWPDTPECKKFLQELRKNKTLHPSEWYSEKFGRERTHAPVVGVSWYEAMAYCNWWTQHYADEWLQRHRDWFPNAKAAQMHLATEAQWEFAGRRDTGRKYPWGNEPLSPQRLNYNDKIKSTTEVGNYPQGATPDSTEEQKIFDMAGNVWEWCRDWYGERYYDECKKQGTFEDPEGSPSGTSRVVRGGSWAGDSPRLFRAANRSGVLPLYRDYVIGFRVVVVPQS
jgi:formylglycine-generating enzyme required for sulfatase activity